jgi:ubiquitin-conjugating enzyme E2 J1
MYLWLSFFGFSNRIMKEYAEFEKDSSSNDYFTARPCEDNLFESEKAAKLGRRKYRRMLMSAPQHALTVECFVLWFSHVVRWHFTIRGPPDSDFQGGRYHGRILLPSQYPFKPPDIVMLTPSGRFETHKKICLSISSFHPKNWQPSWSIRTVLTALIAFFPTPGNGAIGSLEYSSHERKEYALRSNAYTCELCGKSNLELLPDLAEGVSERAGMPQLPKEVTDTIASNKAIPALSAAAAAAGVSQPSTPAFGAAATPSSSAAAAAAPPTPLNLSQGQRIAASMPSNPMSPLLARTFSAPVQHAPGQQDPVGEGSMLPPPSEAMNAAAVEPAATPAGPQVLSPLVLDEGLRQRQGRVVTIPLQAAQPAPAAVTQAAPAPAVAVAAPRAAPLSSVTVFLSFLILLILARKIWGTVNRQQNFGLDLPTD